MKMKGFFVFASLMVLMAITSSTPVNAQTTHYLNLGADPQNPGRQLQDGEVAILTDTSVCDPAWGSHSGKKSNGCYPPNTLVFARATDHVLNAVGVCGNEPSGIHVVTGKIVELKAALPATLPDTTAPQTGQITYSSSTTNINFSQVAEEEKGRQAEPWRPGFDAHTVAEKHGHHGLLIGTVVVVGAVGGILAATMGHHSNSNSGSINTGGAN